METSDINQILAELRDQAATMLDQCDVMQTPTICHMLAEPGNKELLVEAIVELNRKGYASDEAISLLEREYNPNVMDD